MKILFIECCKVSPIRTQIALPFAFLALSRYVQRYSRQHVFHFHSHQLEMLSGKPLTNMGPLVDHIHPDVVMAGAVTCTFPGTVKLLAEAKRSGCQTVLGGIFGSFNPELVLRNHPVIDYIVLGDGESACLNLLEALTQHTPIAEVRGIAFRHKGKVVVNRSTQEPWSSVEFPLLNLDSLPIDVYKKVYQRHYLFAGRGCQHRCNYCTLHSFSDQRVSVRPVEDVLRDARLLLKIFGEHDASLADANVTVNKSYYLELLGKLSEFVPIFSVSVKGRIDEIDNSYLRALKERGIKHIAFGLETPLPSQLKAINKTLLATVWARRLRGILDYATKIGLQVHLNLMIGTPDETERSLNYKVQYIVDLYERYQVRPYLSFYTPHPGTSAAADLQKNGLEIIELDLEHYDHFHPIAVPIKVGDRFVSLLWDAYRAITTATHSEEVNPSPEPKCNRFTGIPCVGPKKLDNLLSSDSQPERSFV